MRKRIKRIADFRPYINKWFGDLRLIAVNGETSVQFNYAPCRVVCRKGHEFMTVWNRVRDLERQAKCADCDNEVIARRLKAGKRRSGAKFEHVTGLKLTEKIEQLSAERRKLFEALMDSRRRAPGDTETEYEDVRYDAWAYASHVPDPAEDLADLCKPIENTREVLSQTGWAMRHYGEHPSRY